MELGERLLQLEEFMPKTERRVTDLEEKVERLLAELKEIRETSGRAYHVPKGKHINISDSGKGQDR